MSNPALHDALKCLRPIDFSDVPVDDVEGFMRHVLSNGEVIVNSVPQPPGGSDFCHSARLRKDVNGARCAADMTVSEARAPPVDPTLEELQKSWAKPLKTNAKDNPLAVSVFKMAGADRHGAWFARRSVHEGLGFTKWKKAMQREFAESLAVQGGPGVGSIRGIGGDKRLERKVVEGLGQMEVLQLSAQFPGPTAPREFITLLLTSENALGEKSKPHLDDEERALDQVPRHYMVVSIPCEHPDAPPRDGLVRGHYESVEMIREIPITPPKANSESIDRKEEASPDDPESNPVEWIMITRSDPGGGIPRFMVERGTPGSIVADTSKFLDWACSQDEIPDPDVDAVMQPTAAAAPEQRPSYSASTGNAHLAGVGTSIAEDRSLTANYEPRAAPGVPAQENGGMMSSIGSVIGNGIQAYAPQSVASYLQQSSQPSTPSSESDTSSETSSIRTFTSAEQYTTATDGNVDTPDAPPTRKSSDSLATSTSTKSPSGQSRYDKELSKLDAKRAALDEKQRKTREKEESRTQQMSEREQRERRKTEEKYEKDMAKLQAKREKEAKKLEDKRKKEADKNGLQRVQRERDEFKTRAEMAERENLLLKEQVGELQHENTLLVQRVGKTEAGAATLKAVTEELGRGRSESSASRMSKNSKNSKNSSEGKTAA